MSFLEFVVDFDFTIDMTFKPKVVVEVKIGGGRNEKVF